MPMDAGTWWCGGCVFQAEARGGRTRGVVDGSAMTDMLDGQGTSAEGRTAGGSVPGTIALSPGRKRLLRLAALASAALLIGCGVVRGWAPLSTVLITLPAVAVAWWPVGPLGPLRWTITIILLLGAVLVPTLAFLPLALTYDGCPVWWSSLLRGWCLAGIAGCAAACAWRIWSPGSARWREIPAHALLIMVVVGATPLSGLYVQQISSGDYPNIVALSTRTDSWIHRPDGVDLHVRTYVPVTLLADGKPRGVAVFTHGFSGWKEAFLNHHRLFLEAGWAVVAYDLRGHGRSSPSVMTYGGRDVDDLLAVWQQARALANGRPLAAYGVSLGSSVTLLAAERLRDCRVLVVESPFADLADMSMRRLAAPIRPLALAVARYGAGFDPGALRPGDARLPSLACRAVVGWITGDRVVPAEQSRAIAAHFPDAFVLASTVGAHLDLIVQEPWRALVRSALSEAER